MIFFPFSLNKGKQTPYRESVASALIIFEFEWFCLFVLFFVVHPFVSKFLLDRLCQ